MDITTDRLCANEPEIASKIMDGEAILINLQTGAYYSLRDAGAVVWQAVCGHRTRQEILDRVVSHFGRAPDGLDNDLSELLGQFQEENLVRKSERLAAQNEQQEPLPRSAYSKPRLEKFSDMQDLLALDPPTPGALDGLMRQGLGGRDR
jgi:hypothetical protein